MPICRTFILFTLIICFHTTDLMSQKTLWQGKGLGLSHLEIYEDHIKLQTLRDAFEEEYDYITLRDGEILVMERVIDDMYKHAGKFEANYLDDQKDSLVLEYKTGEYLFVRDDKYKVDKPIKYVYFVYELLDSWRGTIEKIEFNKYGILRKSNRENKTLIEFEVNKDDLENFEEIISKLDIANIYATDRMMNMCNDNDHSFTFIDTNKQRYNYTAIAVRKSLEPVLDFLNQMIENYERKKD